MATEKEYEGGEGGGEKSLQFEDEQELLREQEQARASQILLTPPDKLSSILTPRDLIRAGEELPNESLDYGDGEIERTPSGRRVLEVKRRLRNLRSLPCVGNSNKVTVGKPAAFVRAIHAKTRMVTLASSSQSGTSKNSSVGLKEFVERLESENKQLRLTIASLQRSLELSRSSYDVAIATLLKAVEHDERVIADRTRTIHALVKKATSMQNEMEEQNIKLQEAAASMQGMRAASSPLRLKDDAVEGLRKQLKDAVDCVRTQRNVIQAFEAKVARADEDAIKLEHRLTESKKREKGFKDQLREIEAAKEIERNSLKEVLERAAKEEGLDMCESISTATEGETSMEANKFNQPRALTYGLAKDATLGLTDCMCVDEETLFSQGIEIAQPPDASASQSARFPAQIALGLQVVRNWNLGDGVDAIKAEIGAHGTVDDRECLQYVLYEEAGTNDKQFQNGWKRDCDEMTGKRLPEREIDGRGMTFHDFCESETAKQCGLRPPHVLALRLYSTIVFMSINLPLRDIERKKRKEAHKLPILVYWLSLAIKRLRTVAADSGMANTRKDFYRGISNAAVLEQFLLEGGTELAPMSASEDARIALKYARSRGNEAVLLRIRTSSCMQQGADLRWVSCFPYEREYVYPPITFLRPIRQETDKFEIGKAILTVVDVEPSLA